ncbi:helix-turn-helix domain-containing protein [Candidatus Uhrbacteria bacterium]|nr:helix-turn-helix domain-containing protein [Candidatus Uhrbacteria bacterium]
MPSTTYEQSLGALLRSARAQYELTLEEVSQALLIRKETLQHFEYDRLTQIPEKMYREQFLKTYATYLGLPWDRVCEYYQAQQRDDVPQRQIMPSLQSSQFWVAHRIMKNSLFAVVALGIVSYIFFLSMDASKGPHLVVTNPPDNFSAHADTVVVAGQTTEDAGVRINGQPIVKNKDGSFEQVVSLQEGVNRIQISATKKSGKEHIIERNIIATPN